VAASALAAIVALLGTLGGGPLAAIAESAPRRGGPAKLPQGGPGGDWRLMFKDEFSGSGLNLDTWRPNWFGSNDRQITHPVDPHADSCVDPRMASVFGGELRLRVERRDCLGHAYAGGLISSNPTAGGGFEFTYGYIEFRAILPAENGIWSAFVINGQSWPADGEIDVLESGLPSASVQRWHYHDSAVGVAGGRVTVPGASTGWHTYAAAWGPGRVRWYFDGDLVATVDTGAIGVPHYVLMNASDWAASNPSGPATTRIDYVRAWQRYTKARR
jgi:beta-glucanase (GH16 family)